MNREKLIDLDKEQLALLDEIIKRHIPNKPVWAYGSRVTWKASEISDLDLVVFDCDPTEVFNLKEAFVESDLLISVDVMDWESIPEKFKENIKQKYVVLQGKIKLEGWREVKLGDIVQLSKKPWRTNDEELPYIGLEHIDENKLRLNSVGSSNSVASNKYRFNAGNTLFGKLRPYFRKVVKPDFGGICSTDIWVVVPKEETNKDFLFYFFANQELVDISYSSSSGTRMPRADWTFLSETVWALPPLPEQKAIAEVLSSLDDKIDLLHRQNKTLENIAQTLFRQWFIEDADEDWETNKIPDEFDLTMGQSPPGKSYNEEKNGIPMFQGNADFGFRFPKNRVYTTQPKRFAEKYNTLISVRAPVGEQNMAKEKCCIGRGVAAFRHKKDGSFYTYTYFKMMSLMNKVKQFNQEGTVFGSISKSDFENFSITIPPIKLVQTFQKIVKPIDDKIIFNQSQIHTLENLRDTLLPKLMSGVVKINQ